jgi:hypothetical protein
MFGLKLLSKFTLFGIGLLAILNYSENFAA